MKSVNADVDRMNDFMKDIKRHKEDLLSKQKMILYKLNNLGSYWKDKAYVDKKELENIEYKIRKMEQFKKENDL